ncbi:hypothetical protein [Emcibacter sp.]|uniref:hypothetical protein n=1 Tax=Emcibacter sp. TaxID=1979954 RepID=UPI003A8FAFD2
MIGKKRSIHNVMGHEIDRPRLTKWGYQSLIYYVGIPSVLLLMLLDVVLYFLFRYAFDSCYGIFCYL